MEATEKSTVFHDILLFHSDFTFTFHLKIWIKSIVYVIMYGALNFQMWRKSVYLPIVLRNLIITNSSSNIKYGNLRTYCVDFSQPLKVYFFCKRLRSLKLNNLMVKASTDVIAIRY